MFAWLHKHHSVSISCFPDKKRNRHEKPALCPWVQFVELKRRGFYCYVTQKWSSHVWRQFQKTGLPSCHMCVHSLQHPPPQSSRLPPDFPGRDGRLKLLQCQLRPRYLAANSFKMQSQKLSAGNAPHVCCQMSQCQLTMPQFHLGPATLVLTIPSTVSSLSVCITVSHSHFDSKISQ